jgi:hypothetical protein
LHERWNNLEQNEYTNMQQDAEIQYYEVRSDGFAFGQESRQKCVRSEGKVDEIEARLQYSLQQSLRCVAQKTCILKSAAAKWQSCLIFGHTRQNYVYIFI